MSAWIVSKQHMDSIVETAVVWMGLSPSQAIELGRDLWTENLKSVAYRYPHDGDGERPGPIGLTEAEIRSYVPDEARPLSPNEMLKALCCLDYQSCEHPEWPTSSAFNSVSELTAEAEKRGASHDSPEYNRAPWGID